MGKITISQELIDDLNTYANNMGVGMAAQIRDELTNSVIDSLGAFYSHYTPTSYKRHYYNFMDNVYQKYYKNPHSGKSGGIVRGGVELSPDFLDDIYKADTETVFNSVMSGYHGYVSNLVGFNGEATSIPIMKPSPMELILKDQKYIIDNIQKYKKYGYQKAKNWNLYSTFV